MAITLGGVTLPDLAIADEFSIPQIRAISRRTAGGGIHVQEYAIASGRPLDLYGGDDWGWITRTTLSALYALISPGATLTLVYESNTWSVRFRVEEIAIEATPLLARPNHAGGDYYNNVIIRLMRL